MYFIAANVLAILFFSYLAFHGLKFNHKFLFISNAAGVLSLLTALVLELLHLSSREELMAFAVATLTIFYGNLYFLFYAKKKVPSAFYFHHIKIPMPDIQQDAFEVHFMTDTRAFLQQLDLEVESLHKESLFNHWQEFLRCINRRDLQQMLDHLRAIDRVFPHVQVKVNTAAALIERGDAAAGISLLQHLFADPQPWELNYNKAIGLLKIDRVEAARVLLAQLNHQHIKCWKTAFALARVDRKLGKYREACKFYNFSARLATQIDKAWCGLGKAQYRLGEYEKALAAFDHALQLNAANAIAWYDRGNTLMRLGEYLHAAKSYKKAIEQKPQLAPAWHNLAIALNRLGKRKQAIRCLRKALSLGSEASKQLFIRVRRREAASEPGKINPYLPYSTSDGSRATTQTPTFRRQAPSSNVSPLQRQQDANIANQQK